MPTSNYSGHTVRLSDQSKSRRSALVAPVVISIIASGALLCQPAYAADVTRTYTWADGQAQPSIPQTITGTDGQTMTISRQGNPVRTGGNGTMTQHFDQSATYTVPNGTDMSSSVPGTLHIDSDGYSGDIPRTGFDYTPIYRNDSNHTTINRDFTVSSTNGSEIPQTVTDSGVSYSLENVTYDNGYTDSNGTVYTWTAHATYGADSTTQVLDHYNVTAHYSGDLSKQAGDGEWSVSVTYHSDDAQNANTNEGEQPGVTSTFDDVGNFGAPESPNSNDEVNENSNNPFDGSQSNGNTDRQSSNGDDNGDQQSNEQQSWLAQHLPVLIGAIAALAAALIALIAVLRKKKHGAAEEQPAVLSESDVNEAAPTCQLIEVTPVDSIDENGDVSTDYDQKTIANLEMDVSDNEDVPSVAYLPSMVDADGNRMRFEPENGAQYWIAVSPDASNSMLSDSIILATDDDYEVARFNTINDDGDVEDQFQVDSDQLTKMLNIGADEGNGEPDETSAQHVPQSIIDYYGDDRVNDSFYDDDTDDILGYDDSSNDIDDMDDMDGTADDSEHLDDDENSISDATPSSNYAVPYVAPDSTNAQSDSNGIDLDDLSSMISDIDDSDTDDNNISADVQYDFEQSDEDDNAKADSSDFDDLSDIDDMDTIHDDHEQSNSNGSSNNVGAEDNDDSDDLDDLDDFDDLDDGDELSSHDVDDNNDQNKSKHDTKLAHDKNDDDNSIKGKFDLKDFQKMLDEID